MLKESAPHDVIVEPQYQFVSSDHDESKLWWNILIYKIRIEVQHQSSWYW